MESGEGSHSHKASGWGSKGRYHKTRCGNAEAATKLKLNALALKHPSKVQEKVEKHLQNTLEKQVQRSLKAAEKRKHIQEPAPAMDLVLVDHSLTMEPGPSISFQSRALSPSPLRGHPSRGRPISTPITLGVPQGDWQALGWETEMPPMVQQWIAEAVQHRIEATKQLNRQSTHRTEVQTQERGHTVPEPAGQGLELNSDSSESPSEMEDFLSMGEDQWEQELSEEEGLLLDQPTFKGLFRSHLFKPLLIKAKSLLKRRLLQNRWAHGQSRIRRTCFFLSQPLRLRQSQLPNCFST